MLKDEHAEAAEYNANAKHDDKSRATTRALVKALIAKVALEHRSNYGEVTGSSRLAYIVRARQYAIAEVARHYPQFSTSMIGRMFKKDHSTVLWALHRAGMPPRNKQGRPTFNARPAKALPHLGKDQELGDGGTLTTKETPHGME